MGHTAGLDGCGKSRPPPGFDPRTAQPVASRYTDRLTIYSTLTYIHDRAVHRDRELRVRTVHQGRQ